MSFDFTQVKPYKVDVRAADLGDAELHTCDNWSQGKCSDFMDVYGELLKGTWSPKLSRKISQVGLDEVMLKTGILEGQFEKLFSCSTEKLDPYACPFSITRVIVPGNELHEEVRIEGEDGIIFKICKGWQITTVAVIAGKKERARFALLKSPDMFKQIRERIHTFHALAARTKKALYTLRFSTPLVRLILEYMSLPMPKAIAANNLRSRF